MKRANHYRVPQEKLRRICQCEQELEFCQTSLDVPPLEQVVGQERAVRAMQFGLQAGAPGYNIFVVGPPGTGKGTYVQAIVSQAAVKGSVPLDWCYINNFLDHDKPLAISMPAGKGREFQQDMAEFIADLRVAIPKAFEGSDYEQQKDAIIHTTQKKMETLYHQVEKEATEVGFQIKQTPSRFVFMPLKDGEPISNEDFDKLPQDEKNDIEAKGHRLEKRLDETLRDGRLLEKQVKEQILELEKQITLFAAGPLVNKVKDKYGAFPKILEYLDTVFRDVAANHEIFKSAGAQPPQPFALPQDDGDALNRYKVNLFVNHEGTQGAPVVSEPSPYYYNLMGKIEYRSQMLALSTEFTMVKAGAIHRANGGYLILQAKDLLMDPFAWDALKKALKYRQAVVENIGEQYRFVPTVTLRPEPIPLDVKVVLIGSPIYYLIFSYDEDFQKLFKVKVDFDVEMLRTPENIHQYVSFISALCHQGSLPHFDRSGLGKIIEYGSRLAGHQDRLSTRFNEISDTAYEAITLAQGEGAERVSATHVDRAIAERRFRANRLEEKIQEEILQEKVLIQTEGGVVGQVNGLSVIDLGGIAFGLPSRITARTYAGRGGVINIERETEMSGSIHSKGVLTLAGYLGGQLAQDKPLSLTAQITFEQTYSGVDGDSASSAELYAILSSLSGVPLDQGLAVTGSVDQRGVIQPVGAVTEKIEGFFDICAAKGLTGRQGVIIPARNIDNLMLKNEVLEAVQKKRFHIYAVQTIEEGLELLSGFSAGKLDAAGRYPEKSIFGLADLQLQLYNKWMAAGLMEGGGEGALPKGPAGREEEGSR